MSQCRFRLAFERARVLEEGPRDPTAFRRNEAGSQRQKPQKPQPPQARRGHAWEARGSLALGRGPWGALSLQRLQLWLLDGFSGQ